MKIVCIGGGPAGLYFGLLMKSRHPEHDITVVERNLPYDTFGWGVVLSDDALGRMQRNDAKSTEAIRASFAYWDDIAVVHNGERTVSGGHGFAGIGRKAMLILLQQRARELGVTLRFETEFKSAADYRKDYDIVVGCDGINSVLRKQLFPDEGEPLYSGVNMWRGVTRWSPMAHFQPMGSFCRSVRWMVPL